MDQKTLESTKVKSIGRFFEGSERFPFCVTSWKRAHFQKEKAEVKREWKNPFPMKDATLKTQVLRTTGGIPTGLQALLLSLEREKNNIIRKFRGLSVNELEADGEGENKMETVYGWIRDKSLNERFSLSYRQNFIWAAYTKERWERRNNQR